jgi:hypothetical protein
MKENNVYSDFEKLVEMEKKLIENFIESKSNENNNNEENNSIHLFKEEILKNFI